MTPHMQRDHAELWPEIPWLAAGAMKLVADCFPWGPESCFAYMRDNHNSVVGMH